MKQPSAKSLIEAEDLDPKALLRRMHQSRRYRARFFPLRWRGDWLIPDASRGPEEWDVTDYLHTLKPGERKLAIQGNAYESQNLRYDPAAPDWMKSWCGPFEIRVTGPDDL